MKCNVGDERTVVLTYCGRKIIKNNDIIYVEEKDLTQPEISFLIRKSLLVVVSDENGEEMTVRAATHPEAETFQCTLPKGRRMAIDTIKGTVEGGKKIEIKKKDLLNSDVNYCVRSGILVRVGKEIDESKVEEITIKMEKPTVKPYNEKEEKEEKDPVQDVKIEDIQEEGGKEEQPKFRVEDSATEAFKAIAAAVYESNKPVTRAKKNTETKPKSTKKSPDKKTPRKRSTKPKA